MADQFDVEYGLDASEASAELQRLQSHLKSLTADLLQSQKTIETRVGRMLKSLSAGMEKVNAGGAYTKKLRDQELGFARTLGLAGRGGYQGQQAAAAAQAVISDIRNNGRQLEAKVTSALVDAYGKTLRNSGEAVAARMRKEEEKVNRLLTTASRAENVREVSIFRQQERQRQQFEQYQARRAYEATPDFQNRQLLAGRREQDRAYEAQYGRAALGWRNTRERLNSNGGADLLGVQAQVMTNGLALGAAFQGVGSLLQSIGELDRRFYQFQAISQATDGEMKKLKKSFMDISETVPFTTVEIADAATTLAQAGLSAREVGESLGSIAQLATASGSNISASVDLVTSALTSFNLSTSQTDDVVSLFVNALNLSKLSIDRLQVAFNYVGATAAEMGISIQETVAALGALSQSGARASTSATGMRALLEDLTHPSKKFSAALKELNLTQEDVNVTTQGFLPVLQRLKDAGFNGALAYGAFETRAAAAYVALSSNVEIAYKLQKAFTLSNAATEASAKQMESLSATSTRFFNVISNAAFTAFEPVVRALQGLMSMAADALGVLGRFPGLLEAIAIGVTAVGGAIAVSTFGTLIRGLSTAIPLLASFGAGFTGAAGGVGVFSAAWTGLTVALSTNPWTALIAAVIAAGAAIYSLSSNTDEAQKRMDELNTRANELAGRTDAVDKKIRSLDEAIAKVVEQKSALDSQPLMREARIAEVIQQFKDLGLNVDAAKASTTQLLREMVRLRNLELDKKIVATRDQLRAEEVRQNEQAEKITTRLRNREDYQGLAAKSQGVFNAATMRQFGLDYAQDGSPGDPQAYLVRKVANLVAIQTRTPEINRVAKVLSGDQSALRSGAVNAGLLSRIGTTRGDLEARIRDGGLSPDALEKLQGTVDLIKFLEERFAQINADVLTLESYGSSIDLLKLQNTQNITANTATAKAAGDALLQVKTDTDAQLEAVKRSNKGPSDRADALEQISTMIKERTEDIRQSADQVVAEALAKDPALDPKQVRDFFLASVDQLATDTLAVQSALNIAREENSKKVEKSTRVKLQSFQKDLARLTARRTDALTPEAVANIQKQANLVFDNMRDAILKQFQPVIAAAKEAGDEDKADELTEEMNRRLSEVADNIDEFARNTVERNKEIVKAQLKLQQDTVEDQIKGLNKKIDETIAQIKTTAPGAAMDALVAKFNDLMAQLTGALGTSNSISMQQTSMATGSTPVTGTQAQRANGAIAMFMKAGMSKNAALGFVANLIGESGLRPDAAGDRDARGTPSSFGIAQWHKERATKMNATLGARSGDLTAQLEYALHELMTDYKSTFDAAQAAATPQDATRIIMRGFERPKEGPGHDPLTPRLRIVNTLSAPDYDSQVAQTDKIVQDAKDAQAESTRKSIVNGVNVALKSANAAITKAMGDLKFTSTPEGVTKIRKTVQDQYAKILKDEEEKFAASNVDLQSTDAAAYDTQLGEVREKVRADMAKDLARISEEYLTNREYQIDAPVREAKTRLEVAQQPQFANKYTDLDRQRLQQQVADAERIASAEKVKLLEDAIAQTRNDAAAAPAGSDAQNDALQRELELKERLVEASRQKNAEDAATASQGPSVAQAIQSANMAWAQQQGLRDQAGDMIPLATQVGETWGEVLGGLQSGFEGLFTDIFSGTMKAEDAFKKFGLSVVQTVMSIIAKKLATQLVDSLFGGIGGGGAAGGSLLSGLFGIPGKANGGGIPGAATGQIVRGGVPNRDSVLRKLMPGEMVLRKSAVDVMGTGFLDDLNNQGSRVRSQSPFQPIANDNAEQQNTGGVVNVYVVAERPVTMGPNDVIATISDNIQRKGAVKQLIKQVQLGAI